MPAPGIVLAPDFEIACQAGSGCMAEQSRDRLKPHCDGRAADGRCQVRRPMTADLFTCVGEALWVADGRSWRDQLAEALNVNPRRVRAWAAGEEKVPEGVWRELCEMLRQQAIENAQISGQIMRLLYPEEEEHIMTPEAKRLRLGRMLREADRWMEILGEMAPYEAAERIAGDLCHYRKYYRDTELSSNYTDDMERLAGALMAIAALSQGEELKPFVGESLIGSVAAIAQGDEK